MSVLVVGLAGGSGAGKSTLADQVARLLGDQLTKISMDDYYYDIRKMDQQDPALVNFDSLQAIEVDLMVQQLGQLKSGCAIDCPRYDFETHYRLPETRRVEPAGIILIDGIMTLADARLRRQYDLSVYVDLPPDQRFFRRLQRDCSERGRTAESVIQQWRDTVMPFDQQVVQPSAQWADVVVRGDRLERVAAALRAMLAGL